MAAPQDINSIVNLTVEGIDPMIPQLLVTGKTLAMKLSNSKATRVSNRLYRIVMQIALAGGDGQLVNPDGGPMQLGSPAQWIAGGVTPTYISTGVNWTELTAMIGQKVDGVAIQNVVSKGLTDIVKMNKNWQDIGLHTDGTGTLATLQSAPSGKTVTLVPTLFGARNIEIGQSVDIVNPTGNVKRGSLTVANKTAYLGSAQTFTYTGADVAGATTNDIVRFGGLTDGVPKWINGLRYMINISNTGELHGIPRTTPQVVANGFDMAGSSISRPAIQLLISQRRARVDDETSDDYFWYTHDTQKQSLKEIGYDLQFIPMQGGKAQSFDPFFDNEGILIEGKQIAIGNHADQQAWYLITPESIGWVKFGDPWFPEVNGSRAWNTYSQSGVANFQKVTNFVNPMQSYCNNAPAQGCITGCGVPAGFLSGL